MADKSFLATVKDELTEAFAAQYDELSDVTTDEDKLAASLKACQKTVWDVVERRLKESYLNGKKGGGNGSEKRPNPFRKS